METHLTDRQTRSGQPGYRRRVWGVLCLLLLAFLLPACRLDALPGLGAGPRGDAAATASGPISQWAATATASSFYGLPDWSPNRATGAPDVTTCSDDARAWSSARGNGVEWLELTYSGHVYATEVRVYQTFGRGAVSRISLIDVEGNAQVAWEGEDVTAPCPGVLIARVAQTSTRIAAVRIDLDESRTGFWNQIDAVELIGVP
jgi:hypothetical protein